MPSDTIRNIEIRGFKSIASLDLKLKPINVIIGANGSGKPNFLDVFRFLRKIRFSELGDYVKAAGGADRILHFGSKTTEQIDLRLSFNFPSQLADAEYGLTLKPTADDRLFPSQEYLRKIYSRVPESLQEWQKGLEAGIGNHESETITKGLRQQFDWWRVYHFADVSSLRKTSPAGENRLFLSSDGRNLAGFLFRLSVGWQDSYREIVRTVQQVAPFFDTFEFPQDERGTQYIQFQWRHRHSDQYFDASSLSDGTLRFIALATLFLQPQKIQSVVLVDEPELGLHPYAIEVLAALIRQASVNTQVIVSTQSSLLLDHLEPDDVLVADRVDGGTQMRRLRKDEFGEWLEDYSLGQLWEKNEFGGRPVPG